MRRVHARMEIIPHITTQNGKGPQHLLLLNDLMRSVFGFSFEQWHALGFWGPEYESHSILSGGHMAANACVYRMKLRIYGQTIEAGQLGAVATRPEYAKRGYASALIRHILSSHGDMPCFLFANEQVLDFYPRFGFRRIRDHSFTIRCPIAGDASRARKLACMDPLVIRALRENACVSAIFDVEGASSVEMFNLMAGFSDDCYYVHEKKLLIVAQQTGAELLIAKIAAPTPVHFEEVKAYLPFSGVETVRFGFCPDAVGVSRDACELSDTDNLFFATEALRWPERFTFPVLCMT